MIQNWKRQIAYKLNVNDIISSKYVKSEGLNPNYLEINAKEVFRLNVIGVVVEKMGHGHHAAIIIDDGTSKISSRSFENSLIFDEINVGDIVLVIGKPREFSSEKYILAEIVKKIMKTRII
ncbi:hypothetical protein HYX01_01405 [Candidatus Woesearchaeota archaeon]|nr:hypothetical protein [Candidatus Woesearchaeota archaeon]